MKEALIPTAPFDRLAHGFLLLNTGQHRPAFDETEVLGVGYGIWGVAVYVPVAATELPQGGVDVLPLCLYLCFRICI